MYSVIIFALQLLSFPSFSRSPWYLVLEKPSSCSESRLYIMYSFVASIAIYTGRNEVCAAPQGESRGWHQGKPFFRLGPQTRYISLPRASSPTALSSWRVICSPWERVLCFCVQFIERWKSRKRNKLLAVCLMEWFHYVPSSSRRLWANFCFIRFHESEKTVSFMKNVWVWVEDLVILLWNAFVYYIVMFALWLWHPYDICIRR